LPADFLSRNAIEAVEFSQTTGYRNKSRMNSSNQSKNICIPTNIIASANIWIFLTHVSQMGVFYEKE
jgi:hypothetical protein